MKSFNIIVAALLVIGGLNWGLVGLFNFDLVESIFGDMTALSRIVYGLVGLSALYQIIQFKSIQQRTNVVSESN
nr:DUF378 domain-containing protein [candidate division Zixibacteria bacterium]